MEPNHTNITIPQVASFTSIEQKNTIVITDENIFNLHSKKFKKYNTIVVKSGEKYKNQTTINSIIKQLIELGANRVTTLVGVGGGVITDMTGFIASIYMRGISFGFVPTTLLALVDASIGGKNGIDIGVYKNMIGTINQPKFILHDLVFLNTLPQTEWQNGFAEIIKHACIKDVLMFEKLQSHSLKYYQSKKKELCLLIQQNAAIKTNIVAKDVTEKGDRKLLNFGHTLGHAIENQYKLSHGQAISIGMSFACKLSEELIGFKQTKSVVDLLEKYGLPTKLQFNSKKVFEVLKMDKKREKKFINYILLEKIGKGKIVEIGLNDINRELKKMF
jgi:3-dehydroquinate synthase